MCNLGQVWGVDDLLLLPRHGGQCVAVTGGQAGPGGVLGVRGGRSFAKTLDIATIATFFGTFVFESPSQRPIYTIFACKYVQLLRLFCDYSQCFYTFCICIANKLVRNICLAFASRRYLAAQTSLVTTGVVGGGGVRCRGSVLTF